MNYNSLLNLGFIDKILSIFDIIPKVIYFVFAAIASAVDAMQALVRKLAGLDVYYDAGGNPIKGQDPLTEFLYGILGFGESAPVYEALNTVFWSLAIFGVIVLVISTIVAIIKSHYNEDTAGTSPWKYIYTSLKAIFTFVVVPVAVIVGMNLTSFLLRTMDQITAGAGATGEVEAMYGKSVVELFEGEETNTGNIAYAHYDYFGAHGGSSTTTFAGMLFNASMYSANRTREGDMTLGIVGGIRQNGVQIFGNSEVVEGIQSGADKVTFVASQIDYAFANCLVFKTSYSYSELKNQTEDAATVWAPTDIFGMGKTSVKAFSKWDVSTVWIFYNLYHFNFIIAFVGGFTVFAIMISIIIGLMTRLIKGAALFLIYPSILGLAPMDNFKAFKSWSSNFMQQIFMAIGSIVGINILLLLLPFLQNIKFFNIQIIDAMINLVVLIAGLLMAKDFITMVSGFVGGADANSIGAGMKGEIGANIKKGASMGVKAGKLGAGISAVGVKAGVAVGKKAFGAGKTLVKAARSKGAAKRADKKRQDAKSSGENLKDIRGNQKRLQKNIDKSRERVASANKSNIDNAREKAEKKARGKGFSEDKVKALGDKAANKALADSLKKDSDYQTQIKNMSVYEKGALKEKRKFNRAREKENKIKSTYGLVREAGSKEYKKTKSAGDIVKEDFTGSIKNSLDSIKGTAISKDKDGKVTATVGDMFKKETWQGLGKQMEEGFKNSTSWKGIGKSIADSFKKTLDEGAAGLGIDKAIKGATDVLKSSLSTTPPPKKGDDLVKDQGAKREKEAKEMAKKQDKTNELLSQLLDESKKNGNNSGGSNS